MADLSEKTVIPTDVIFLFDTKAANRLGRGAALLEMRKFAAYAQLKIIYFSVFDL